MRIHTIRLANLNALTGTWEIDLDHPAYNDNIYALTGPTGAGKTTILDAISLALYGRTPRLARIGKAGNEIMSRHSGTCHAEITFSTRTGRYRSHWSQHRARRKAGGELQNPKHELADAESGELLATGLKDVAAAIERLTGMDYQRFTRAMLLAQGDFAAFLRAAPDERAPLLEQITGTEIYSRISIAVHERLRDALEQQRQLATETAGITPLDAATHTALTQESAALQKQLAALAAAEKHAAAAHENSARADVARKKTETALAAHLQGRLLREYRAEKDNILRELAYHQRIADLEQQRAHLHDGEPCPLCGATAHPYAHELPAKPDDLTARLETLDTYIKRAETLGEQHENAQRALASAREKQQQTENTLALAAEKARNSAVHAEQHAALQQTYAQTLAARQALLANRDPDAEETAQQHAIAEAEAAMEKARDTCQTAQTAAAANQQQRAQLHARLTAQQQELQTAEQQFAAALGMCSEIAAPSPAGRSPQRGRDGEGVDDVPCAPKISTFSISDHPHSNTSSRAATTFPDEAAWQAARLPAATREALARQAAALDQQTLTLHTRQQDRAARLATLTAQSANDPDTATLQARQEADEHTRQQHQQTLASNQIRLGEHDRAVERLAAQQHAIERQEAETRRWQNLHELIGAADGKKYRNYAQSLTFASVIAQANRQLVQLSDRYLLTADPARPLELNIIDNYQGGETRSAKNLSGGESFIVSLALALGLAQMSGENMQIDTLFLDEGFGTLDEETLDSALETLNQLRTHGKHIGIISHVAALTERIATRIQITPQNGGNSIISGPGCRRVE